MKPLKLIFIYSFLFFTFHCEAQQYWHRVGGGLGHIGTGEAVKALLYDSVSNKLIAEGTFTIMDDSIDCGGNALWDNDEWTTLQPFVGPPTGTSLAIFQNKLFAGGNGGVGYYYNSTWQTGGSTNGYIYCMCVYHNKLYVGGDFTNVDGTPSNFIACYDGSSWSAVGGGILCTQFPGSIKAMCVWNDKLIVGGSFDLAGSLNVRSVAAWNDTTWSTVGNGVTYTSPTNIASVYALCIHDSDLIVGGKISHANLGTVPVNNICGWNGINWFELGMGVSSDIHCLLSWDSSLYVGGGFASAGGVAGTSWIAKWKNIQWYPVGSGLIGNSFSLCVYDSVLYAAGSGYTIDGNISAGIVRLMDVGNWINEIDKTSDVTIYPNPVSERLTVNSKQKIEEIQVVDITGRKIFQTITHDSAEINVSSLASGIYLLRVEYKSGDVLIRKFVKE